MNDARAESSRSILAALVVLVLLSPPAPAQEDPDSDPPAAEKAKPTAADLEARLAGNRVTVDWKEAPVLDAINELQQKSGVRFFFGQALADFCAGRRVTYDGYQVGAREALAALERTGGFATEVDVEAGGFKLVQDPAHPTRVLLEETRISVDWKGAAVSRAVSDLEKRGKVKIVLHEIMKARLRSRKITWDAEKATLKEAIETLFVLPPPSVEGRIDAKPGGVVEVVYTGPAESKSEIEHALDDARVSARFADRDLADATAELERRAGGRVTLEVEKGLAKEGRTLSLALEGATLRSALDALAKAAQVSWKNEGKRVLLRPPPKEK
jgi:hypothetical protein